MLKSKILNILFIIFLFCLVPNVVSAANIETETTTLDLTTMEESEDNLENKGWKWDNENKILTLRNANFNIQDNADSTQKNPCIKFLESENITVVFEGNNTLKAQGGSVFSGKGAKTGSLTFKGSQDAILNMEITEINGKGGNNVGDTINYAKNLNFVSGTINSRGGIIADGIVTISGGNLNIDTEDMNYISLGETENVQGIYALDQVKITGGNLNIKSNSNAIRVVGGPIGPSTEGIIIEGGNISLSTKIADRYAITVGTLTHKDIIINGGNITLAGDYGLYTKNGVIKVNHFESFNADGVKKDVFKVAEEDGNEIIYADADYSKVDKVIESANKLNKANYKDFSSVEKAIAAVIRGKNILEQKDVDIMAEAITNAINALELKDADYSKVDEAIEAANKLNKADYKDFSDVEKAIASVVRGKSILEQDDVDAMAEAITDAINSLEFIEIIEKDDIPETTENDDTPETTKKDDIPKTAEKDNTPKTGVEDLTTIVTFIVLVSIVGIVKLSKKL